MSLVNKEAFALDDAYCTVLVLALYKYCTGLV
jgi:hypothetical protein